MPIIDKTNKSALDFHYTISDVIESLTLPLNKLGITCFTFMRFFEDNSYFSLTNNKEWGEYFLMNINKHDSLFDQQIKTTILKSYYVWPQISKENGKFWEIANSFNIYNGFTIYERHPNYVDSWNFYNSNYQSYINFYINNLKKIEGFINIFKVCYLSNFDCMDIEKHAFFKEGSDIKLDSSNVKENLNDNDFFNEVLPSKIPIKNIKNVIIYLSIKEFNVLKQLSNSKSSKQIAQQYNVSFRTVETHLQNIKYKIGIYTKSDLIDFFINLFPYVVTPSNEPKIKK